MNHTPVQLVECPRDAMQGWPHSISTADKVAYLQLLLAVGFHTLDAGSFVSPKAIPQMADTAEVLSALDLTHTDTRLLTIVANRRGAEEACGFEQVHYIGFPFSVSETFQKRNTNAGREEAMQRVEEMVSLCTAHGKELAVYLSMAFGNPYGDAYSVNDTMLWAERLIGIGVQHLSLADTVGMATPEEVGALSIASLTAYRHINWGVHLHATPAVACQKLEAAWAGGMRRFDGALLGIGGCPMAGDALTGNMDTAEIIAFLHTKDMALPLNLPALSEAKAAAQKIFAT